MLRPCLSLSLTSLLSRPVFIQESVSVESLAPTRICEWAEGSFIRGDLSRWEGSILALALSIFRSSFRGSARHRVVASPERCVLVAARSEQPLLAGGHRVRTVPIWALLHNGLRGFGRTSAVLPNVGRQSSARSSARTFECPLIPVSSKEDGRCSGRDPAGHESGNSSCP